MRIGIMTWFHYHNYGTALQAVALAKKIKGFSHAADVVNYIPTGQMVTIPDKKSFLKRGYQFLLRRMRNQEPCCIFTADEREKKFDDFYEENITFSNPCENLSDLERLNAEYDAFVCGSDQIWSPYCFDSHYFLDFVRNPDKLIAYAPSVSTAKIKNPDILSSMKELTKRFSFLSTREEKASALIETLSGKKVETVLDPTLLLSQNEWVETLCLKENAKSAPYLLVYFLGNNSAHWNKVYELANVMKLEVKIIPVFENDLKRNGCIEDAVGPVEFVQLIKDASYVCTDSFHGTIFSVNFQKNFCVFERFRKKDKRNQNLRIHHILHLLGLGDRLLEEKGKVKAVIKDIEYESVNGKLAEQRRKSLEFLEYALRHAEECCKREKPKNHVANYSSLCCGCGTCKAVCPVSAIEIERNGNGFYHVKIDDAKCISCGKCRDGCPFVQKTENAGIDQGTLYSYKDSEEAILERSSSGGVAYRISKMFLDAGWAVVGCMFDKNRQKARHILVKPENAEDLRLLQGSKYMQSDFSSVVKQIEGCERPVVIFGTPCQIAGIKHLLKRRDDVIYIDLICHGVPSSFVYQKYQEYMQENYGMCSDAMTVSFRYKPKGWRTIYIYTADTKRAVCLPQSKDFYFRTFERGHCYSPACYECKWRNQCEADIRIGDYWGERFAEDSTGVSMVLTMTKRGKEVIEKVREMDYNSVTEQPIEDYLSVQQTENFVKPVFYQSFLNELSNRETRFEQIIKDYVEPFEPTEPSIAEKVIRGVLNHVQR